MNCSAEKRDYQEMKRVERRQGEREREMREARYVSVVMQENDRRFIEEVLHSMALLARGSARDSTRNKSDAENKEMGKLSAQVVAELTDLGFEAGDCELALKAISFNSNGSNLKENALNWLLRHVEEHRLPAQFDPRGKQIEIVYTEKAPSAETTRDQIAKGNSTGYAFDFKASEAGLQKQYVSFLQR